MSPSVSPAIPKEQASNIPSQAEYREQQKVSPVSEAINWSEIKKEDLIPISVLGVGGFGCVELVGIQLFQCISHIAFYHSIQSMISNLPIGNLFYHRCSHEYD